MFWNRRGSAIVVNIMTGQQKKSCTFRFSFNALGMLFVKCETHPKEEGLYDACEECFAQKFAKMINKR